MTYFCFPNGWGCYDLNGVAEKTLALTGAHGYATLSLAQTHTNAPPDPMQKAILQTDKIYSLSPVGAGTFGDLSTPNSTGGVTGLGNNLLQNLTGKGANSLWLRIGEGIAGLVILYVALRALTSQGSGQPVKHATSAGKNVKQQVSRIPVRRAAQTVKRATSAPQGKHVRSR